VDYAESEHARRVRKVPDIFLVANRAQIIGLAAKYGLPAIYPSGQWTTSGGLASYGPDALDLFRRAAGYVDRILRGEKPADLPVEAATKYHLVITHNGIGDGRACAAPQIRACRPSARRGIVRRIGADTVRTSLRLGGGGAYPGISSGGFYAFRVAE
jgi:hypothetical protein